MAVESTSRADEREAQPAAAEFREEAMWRALKTVRDPEIPVNIVDLGLIYSAVVVPVEGGKRIEIQMTLTAPGCGMSEVLKKDVETKLARLPEVREVKVEVVFDPPWTPAKMSDDAKLALGFDTNYGAPAESQSAFKIVR